jgi:hypothetical protein
MGVISAENSLPVDGNTTFCTRRCSSSPIYICTILLFIVTRPSRPIPTVPLVNIRFLLFTSFTASPFFAHTRGRLPASLKHLWVLTHASLTRASLNSLTEFSLTCSHQSLGSTKPTSLRCNAGCSDPVSFTSQDLMIT